MEKQPYAEYLKTEHWQTMRRLALELSDGCCALCDATEELDVHHRTYARLGSERLRDLVVLCRGCHGRHHGTLEVTVGASIAVAEIVYLTSELEAEVSGAAFLAAHVERAWVDGVAEGLRRAERVS